MRRMRWGEAIDLVMRRIYAEAHGTHARSPVRERAAAVIAADRYADNSAPASVTGLVTTGLTVEVGGVSQGELNAAVTALYGKREGTRKRQRRRHGITYKQRDEIAQLLLRLFHNGRLHDGR